MPGADVSSPPSIPFLPVLMDDALPFSSISTVVSGNAAYSAAVAQFYGRMVVATDSSNTGIVGAAIQDGANGPSFPVGVVGYGYLNNAGNTVYGLFGQADSHTTGIATNELDTYNYAGAPYNSFPANTGFGTPQILPINLILGTYGAYPAYALIYSAPTSVGTQGAVLGMYLGAGVAVYGIVVDATASVGPAVAATLNTAGAAGEINLFMEMKGAAGAGAQFIGAYNYGGGKVFSVDGAGNVAANSVATAELTFATLPASPTIGQRAVIGDSTLAYSGANIGSAAVGGSNHVAPVIYLGSWVIG